VDINWQQIGKIPRNYPQLSEIIVKRLGGYFLTHTILRSKFEPFFTYILIWTRGLRIWKQEA